MPASRRARSAAYPRLPSPLRRARTVAALALATLAGSCWTLPPAPVAGPDPADPTARTAAVGYRSTVAPYSKQRPVEPAPWRGQNQDVAPRPQR